MNNIQIVINGDKFNPGEMESCGREVKAVFHAQSFYSTRDPMYSWKRRLEIVTLDGLTGEAHTFSFDLDEDYTVQVDYLR